MDEAPVWIAVNGERHVMLSCSPHAHDVLALGHLVAEGWVREPDEVLVLSTTGRAGGSYGVEVRIDAATVDSALALRRHRLAHGCGLRHVIDCERPNAHGRPTAVDSAAPDIDARALFRALFAAADEASPAGGVHAAALSDGRELLHAAVDVARHCAVDRVIGMGFASEGKLGGLGLVTTSRVSAAIALKVGNAGLGWIGSRSIATPLAREIAGVFGVHVLERAARRGGGT